MNASSSQFVQRQQGNKWKTANLAISKGNKLLLWALLQHPVVKHALLEAPDTHMGINAGQHFYDFSQDCCYHYSFKLLQAA